ncbi:hypothetical protein H6F74_21295 [Trichocoleus sp. FACHB-90]|uniref:hypothetical protein n=1 Tax=Cyanophyceae TaxID=3028117 RepID=UPI0016835341|nr:hypothetical protein [Trichocoleus sp. FACHB-90]MBD1928765.1 hypothetical protein [Trichocoleus sp. FACHB-90]
MKDSLSAKKGTFNKNSPEYCRGSGLFLLNAPKANLSLRNKELCDLICLTNKISKHCQAREDARKLEQQITVCGLADIISTVKPPGSFVLTALVS